jgi:hypothetical protein
VEQTPRGVGDVRRATMLRLIASFDVGLRGGERRTLAYEHLMAARSDPDRDVACARRTSRAWALPPR